MRNNNMKNCMKSICAVSFGVFLFVSSNLFANEYYNAATNLYAQGAMIEAGEQFLLAEQAFTNMMDKFDAGSRAANAYYTGGDMSTSMLTAKRLLEEYTSVPTNFYLDVQVLLMRTYYNKRNYEEVIKLGEVLVESDIYKGGNIVSHLVAFSYEFLRDPINASVWWKKCLLRGGAIREWTASHQNKFNKVLVDVNDKEGYRKFCSDLNFLIQPLEANITIKTLLTRLSQGL